MPCDSGQDYESELFASYRAQKARIDVLTRRLCHACQLLLDASRPLPAELA